jgi:hypothetical protein
MLSLENSIYSAPYYGAIGDTITFWFEYLNSNTSVVRSPKVESYKLVIGQTALEITTLLGMVLMISVEKFQVEFIYMRLFQSLTSLQKR